MKQKACITLLYLLFSSLSVHMYAQNSIPNSSFENWSIVSSKVVPDGWQAIAGNIVKDSAGYQSNYAIKLEVAQVGFAISAGFAKTGFPLNSLPSNLTGYVKCNLMPNDTVYIDFTGYSGSTIVTTVRWTSTSSIATYTPFSISIDSSGIVAMDSAVITLTSGCCTNFGGANIGTELVVDELELEFYTGIEGNTELEKKKDLLIYPNPSTDAFAISIRASKSVLADGSYINIYNTFGELVYRAELFDVNSDIIVPKLSQGIYFVRVYDGHKAYMQKIICQ